MLAGAGRLSQNRYEYRARSVDDPNVTEPAGAGGPALAVTQSIPVVSERCAQCSAPLADDQRYCLQCGEPRPHVGGLPSGSATDRVAQVSSNHGPPQVPPGAPPFPPGTAGTSPHESVGLLSSPPGSAGPPLSPPGFSVPGQSGRNNSLALIAGVGVLLLAMGVGVLIGRAGAGSAKPPPAQVISVGGAAGAAGAATTPTTTTPEAPAPPSSTTKKAAKAKLPTGTGSSITKPAPPSAAQNLRSGGSGQSYEQKSKNLPNVVSTG